MLMLPLSCWGWTPLAACKIIDAVSKKMILSFGLVKTSIQRLMERRREKVKEAGKFLGKMASIEDKGEKSNKNKCKAFKRSKLKLKFNPR